MKKGRIILSAAFVLAALGSAFALKASKFSTSNLYTHVTGTYRQIPCATSNQGLGNCLITATVYTRNASGVYTPYSGPKFATPNL